MLLISKIILINNDFKANYSKDNKPICYANYAPREPTPTPPPNYNFKLP